MILVRHGRPATTGVCYGRWDPPLAESPGAVATQVVAELPPITGCSTSPSPRCRDLAAAIVERARCRDGDVRLTVVVELQELDFGAWEGRPWDEIDREGLDAWAAAPLDHRPGGGESGRDLARRVTGWLQRVGPLHHDHVVVGHAGSLRALAAGLLGLPFDRTWQWPVPHGVPLTVTPDGLVRRGASEDTADT